VPFIPFAVLTLSQVLASSGIAVFWVCRAHAFARVLSVQKWPDFCRAGMLQGSHPALDPSGSYQNKDPKDHRTWCHLDTGRDFIRRV